MSIANIANNLRTQNNRCTDIPIFIVQQKVRDYGYDPDYGDNHVWVHCEGFEASEEDLVNIKQIQRAGKEPEEWIHTGYVDRWEFVTACFTEQGCKDYISVNGHNLKEPRIYAEGSYRNQEWREVVEYLKQNPISENELETKMRYALTEIKVRYINKEIDLPMDLYGVICNALLKSDEIHD